MDSELEEVIRVTLKDMTSDALRVLARSLDQSQRQMQQFTGKVWEVRLGFVDQLTAPLRAAMSAATSAVRAGLEVPVHMVGGVAGMFSAQNLQNLAYSTYMIQALGQGATGAGNAIGIGLNIQLENATAQMTAMTGSAEKAAEIVAMLRTEADKTPFTFQEMAGSVSSLIPVSKATGVSLIDLIHKAEILAASHPEQGLVGAAFALRDTASGGVQSMSDRFDLSRKTIEEWRNKTGNAMIGVDKAMEEMGYNISLVDNLSNTLSGRWSTMTDAMGSFTRAASLGVFERLKGGLESIFQFMNANQSAIDGLAQSINTSLGAAADWLGVTFTSIWQQITNVTTLVQAVFLAWTYDAGAMGLAYDQLRRIFGDTIASAFRPMLQWMMESIPYWSHVLQFLASAIRGGTTFSFVFGYQVGHALDAVRDGLRGAFDALGRFATFIGPIATDLLAGKLREALQTAGLALGGLMNNLLSSVGLMGPIQAAWGTITATADRFSSVLIPLRDTVGSLADAFGRFGTFLRPIYDMLLRGDFQGAINTAKLALDGLWSSLLTTATPAIAKLHELGNYLQGQLAEGWRRVQQFMEPFAPTANRIAEFVDHMRQAFSGVNSGMVALTITAAPLYAAFLALAAVSNVVSGALETTFKWLSDHKEIQTGLVIVMGMVLASMGVMAVMAGINAVAMAAWLAPLALLVAQTWLLTAAQAALNVVMSLNPFVILAVALIGAAAGLVFLYNTSEDFRNIVDPILQWLGDTVNWLWHNVMEPAMPGMAQLWEDLKTNTLGTLVELPARLLEIGGNMINGLIQGMTGVDVIGWVQANITDKIPQFIKDALGIHSDSTVMAGIGGNIVGGLLSGMQAKLPDIMGFLGGLPGMVGGALGGGVGGDVGAWIAAAIQATGVPASWAAGLGLIIQHESGGDPGSANNWDANAKRGDPSVGLMQLTGTNRAHYTPAGMNPMDPIAQVIAGIRYIQDRYQDISRVPGVASVAAGGEYIPYDIGGYLRPGPSMVVNNTGTPEPVLTPSQWASMRGGVTLAPQPGAIVIQVPGGTAPDIVAQVRSALPHVADELWGMFADHVGGSLGNRAAPAT